MAISNFFSNLLPEIGNDLKNDVQNNIVQPVKKYVTQSFPNSPIGQAVQGHWSNILPAIQNAGNNVVSGKTPIMFGAETTEVPGAGIDPATELPKISAPQAPKVNAPVKPANGSVVNKVVAPDANKSLFGSEHTANIQDALRRNGIQDYSQIAGAAHNLYDGIIKPTLTTVPKLIKINDVVDSIVGEMRKMKPGLDPIAAKNAAHSVITDMYDNARGDTTGTSPVPTHIDTPSLFNIKQGLNNTSAVKDYYNGNQPTDLTDMATVASRNALSKVIQNAHPEIAQATKDYGLLNDAVPSLYKETNQAAAEAAKIAANAPSFADRYLPNSILGTQTKPIYNATHDILTNPIGQKALLGAVLVGLGVGGKTLFDQHDNGDNKITNAQENQSGSNAPDNSINTHGGIVSQPYANIKPNTDGTYSLPQNAPDGSNQRHYMGTQDYQNSLKDLSQKYPAGDRDPAYTVAKTQLDTQFANDQKQADEVFKGNNVKNFMDNATQYNADGNQLLGTMINLPTGFWNGVSKTGSIRAYNDPAYASEKQQIDAFNNEFSSAYESVTGKTPTDNQLLDSANSAKQAVTKYNAMMQFISGTYGKYISPYLAVTSATGSQTQYGTPQPLTNNLPPISAPQDATGMIQPGLQQTINSLPPIQ